MTLLRIPRTFRDLMGSIWLIATVLCVLWFYHWTFTTNFTPTPTFPYFTDQGGRNLYSLLVDGYLQGSLSFADKPGPDLLALPDPYDSTANAGHCIREASLYNGKYYLYFGPVPAVTVYLPLRLLLGHHTNDAVVTVLMGAGCFLIGLVALFRFRSLLPGKKSFPSLFICIVALGLNNFFGHMLRRPAVFEVAIISAMFWLLLSICFAITYFSRVKRNEFHLLFSSLSLGLSIGCRYSYVLCSLMLLVPALYTLTQTTKWTWPLYRLLAKRLAATFIPWGMILGLLLLHNYLRFDSPLEFGQKYQLTAVTISKLKLTSLSYIPHNLSFYFFSFIYPDTIFPFFHEFSNHPFFHVVTPINYHAVWNSVGVLNSPFTLLIVIAPIVIILERKRASALVNSETNFAFLSVGLPSAVNIFVLLCFCGIVVRYLLDFVPLLILLSCFIFLYLESLWHGLYARIIFLRTLVCILVFYGVSVNLALSMEGEYQSFGRNSNPKLFSELEAKWEFIPRFFFKEENYGGVALKLKFPTNPPRDAKADPLVTTGSGWLADMISVSYPSEKTIQFGFYHDLGDAKGIFSRPLTIDFNQEHLLEIHVGSLYPRPLPFLIARGYDVAMKHSLQIKVDGVIVMTGKYDFYESLPHLVALGRNQFFPKPIYFNPAMFRDSFSGTILSHRRIPFLGNP